VLTAQPVWGGYSSHQLSRDQERLLDGRWRDVVVAVEQVVRVVVA
jgi:hypothetical protein